MTLPFNVKTLKDITKGGVAGVVILAYALLWMDHRQLKSESREDKMELQAENRRLTNKIDECNTRVYELQKSVIVNNTEALEELREEMEYVKYELKLVNK